MMINNTPFNNMRLYKVSWQKEMDTWSDDIRPTGTEWVTFASTSLMPWCFSATTVEETLKAAHQMKFRSKPMESLTPLEDGSFLMTYNKHVTLRMIMEQEAYVPRHKSNEDFLEEQACMWHDWE